MKTENDFQFAPASSGIGADEMLSALVEAGYSNTRARRAVLAAVDEASGQATPSRLLALGRVHHPNLGLVTVYRTLDILLSLGLVRRLHSDDGCHAYARAAYGHSHHIICQRCHTATEFEGCDIEAVVASVEAQTGFQVRTHWLEMFGLCPQCQSEASKASVPGAA